MALGSTGIWTFNLDLVPPTRSQELAAELEELGYGAIWIPEAVGREAFTNAAILLAGTRRITVATGIASIWGRDAMTMAAAHKTLSSWFPGRFLLGMGVSHAGAVEGLHGHRYERPYQRMVEYLDAMDAALFLASEPPEPPRRVLAALGPKMLRLAAERAAGAHPYLVTPEHTATARSVLGDGPLLAPEQAVALTTDADEARTLGRQHLAIYLDLPNYANNWRRLGFDDDDLRDGGSDRLVDALVAWGDVEDIAARVQAHRDAGADHVCIQALGDLRDVPLETWRELAPALVSADGAQ